MLILPKKRPLIVQRLSFNAVVSAPITANLKDCGVNINKPAAIGISKKEFEKMLSFGFLGGVDPQTYYESANANNILPKPEDFIDVPYRFLSETIVGGNSWKATNFSQKGILKPSTPKLEGKSMFTDHEQASNNVIGMVANTFYASETGSGKDKIPAGVEGFARIDTKTAPVLARQLLTGSLYSASVTADFAWEPSHSFKEAYEFYDKLGTMASDGQMVTRMAQEILDYHEASIVWLGADPFAKSRDGEGNLRNIDHTSVYFSKATDEDKKICEEHKNFEISCGIDETIISLSQRNIKSKATQKFSNKTPKKNKRMNKFLLAFIAAFSKDLKLSFNADTLTEETELDDEQTEELVQSLAKLGLKMSPEDVTRNAETNKFVKGLMEINSKGELVAMTAIPKDGEFVSVPKTTLTSMQEQISKIPSAEDTASLTKRAELGDNYLALKRAECERLYKLSAGDKADDAYINIIKKATVEELDALLTKEGKDAKMGFSAHCTKCNTGEHVEMRSSLSTGEEVPAKSKKEYIPSVSEIADKYNNSSSFAPRKK